jgi:phosphopantothenoylcysteine decarboxylase/phosphopantothenate--cysteine ligase
MDEHLHFHAFAGKRLHLGVCGSVAAFRAAELIHPWQDAGIGVSATLTKGAREFISPLTFEALGASPVYTDLFGGGTPFGHLEPGMSAHALVIAPASADMLARFAQGRAEDMLSCQALAFDGPVVTAPAMNPRMWRNPATQANAALLRERGVFFVGPESGRVACKDEGPGRFADLRAVRLAGLKALTPQDMEGKKALVTLGPTREPWDDVRFWSNSSRGIMGASLAVGAWLRGAEVHAVCGPVDLWLPSGETFHRHDVQTARQMLEAARDLWPSADVGIFTAAVADFRPEPYGSGKFKKNLAADGFSLRFLPNQDILGLLAPERSRHQKIVGFAAESEDAPEALEHAVRRKLLSKGADMMVGNKLADAFGRAGNRVFVADGKGREEHWPDMPKPDVAWKILTWLLTL